MKDSISEAAAIVARADGLIIGAGAGIGVDSGLPDFRGDAGFWRAYPPFKSLGLGFQALANPEWFRRDPELAWGFYGHRLNLYRNTVPHAGFSALLRWSNAAPCGSVVFTSNVDGQFQRAGFDSALVGECHGSIHYLQCAIPCHDRIWPAAGINVQVDGDTFRAAPPLPACSECGAVARPNIRMFSDGSFVSDCADAKMRTMANWIERNERATVALVECGAGTEVPTVRSIMERFARAYSLPLIRINVRESEGPPGTISIPLGALEALTAIDAIIQHNRLGSPVRPNRVRQIPVRGIV